MTSEITLDEVARRSGVSRATASRALNDKPGVRPDVRERVRTIADAIGYRPHRGAKNLAGGRSSLIGLVVGAGDLVAEPYSQALLQAIAQAADRHDEGLMLIMDSRTPNERVHNLLRDGQIDGVIVSAVAAGEQWVEGLLDARMPTVLLGGHPRRTDVPVVDTEAEEATASLVEHLVEQGATRIAYLAGDRERVDAANRLAGYHLGIERAGLRPDESLVHQGDFWRASARAQADDLLAMRPDAILAANDLMAFGVLDRCVERGISVPDDLLVAGFDGVEIAYQPYDLTTMRQPFDGLADRAVRTLVASISGAPVVMEQLLAPALRRGVTTTRSLRSPDSASSTR